ncbi:MAG: phosphoribosylaminoimidazolecarboxamide formyltransferase/IMP cyclohydrolase [Planctomycetota bacterium]|jgi:phosphoribosylaminoimidazolecarboxamide formyltransferase/IMP cyclohydrolase
MKIQRALVSVSDKTGIESFARFLVEEGVEILSTGGTFKAIQAAGIKVREVSDYTDFPEMMNGRVKTLHPKIHGGILALRDNSAHTDAMKDHSIGAIDLVVVNLYPFEETVAKEGVVRAEAVEQIDIGGPSMVRSAAKNHRFVGIVTDPEDYGRVMDEMTKCGGKLSDDLRRELAVKAFQLTARYDAAISDWLFKQELADGKTDQPTPGSFSLAGVKQMDLRYGENPHQVAAFYSSGSSKEPSIANAEVLNGKALSYNNLVDIDAALALTKEFTEPFACVLKHNNPCGAAINAKLEVALEQAWSGDPLSAFGSVLGMNRSINLACAEFLTSGNRFVEAIIAPSFDDDALEHLRTVPKWGKNVRLLACGEFGPDDRDCSEVELKRLVGGFLIQGRDLKTEVESDCKTATKAEPSDQQLKDLLFANAVGKHVKSNSIVLAVDGRVLGVGAGQMSRVDSVKLAIEKAGDEVKGSVLASDAFFPFPDGVETAMEAGVVAILQPGGSVRDSAVIEACEKRDVTMVFTGSRHFRH